MSDNSLGGAGALNTPVIWLCLSFTGHWAPLTSWTQTEWANYSKTGDLPETYEPWNDLLWIS